MGRGSHEAYLEVVEDGHDSVGRGEVQGVTEADIDREDDSGDYLGEEVEGGDTDHSDVESSPEDPKLFFPLFVDVTLETLSPRV